MPLALPAAPLRDSAAACVGSEIYECSGVATSSQDADGHWFLDTTKPGDSFSAAQIREQFANFDTSLLPASGPWFTRGATSADEDCARAKRVAAWLHSAELQAEVGGDVMVMFMSGPSQHLPSPCLASVQERGGCALLTAFMRVGCGRHGGIIDLLVQSLLNIEPFMADATPPVFGPTFDFTFPVQRRQSYPSRCNPLLSTRIVDIVSWWCVRTRARRYLI